MNGSMRATLMAIVLLVVGAAVAGAADRPGDDQEPSLDAMIGQMLMVGFPGASANEASVKRVAQQIAEGRIGGVILMERNIRSPQQLRSLTATLRGAAPGPLFIATDQEGGRVQRLSERNGFRGFPSARRVAETTDPEGAKAIYRRMAAELSRSGINVNFGPSVDLDANISNPIIGRLGRSFGPDPIRVAAYAGAFIAAHHSEGVLTAAKHFPGHGSSTTDSHKGFVDLTGKWNPVELQPYRLLIGQQRPDMVMVGHLYHPDFSPTGRVPASLSRTAIEGMLRQKLHYTGVVVSDDLNMGAIRQNYGVRDAVVRAVNAGTDILLTAGEAPGSPSFVTEATAALREGVASGKIRESRVREAYGRIVDLKSRLALADAPAETSSTEPPVPARRANSRHEYSPGR